MRSILQDAQRHGQRRACWRGSRLAPSPTRRFPCLFWHVTKRATALHHRRRTSANNVSLCPTASSLTRSTAASPGTFRRAGHAAPCAVGPVARDKGYWAASLLPVPWGRRLPGAASARRKDCRPRGLDALMQAQRGSFAFFPALDSQEHFKSRSPFKKDDALRFRFTTRHSAVDELGCVVIDCIYRDHWFRS